jgi:hypothetical protein
VSEVLFFAGVHQPSQAHMVEAAFISRSRLTGPKGRKSPFRVKRWIMDSAAFTTILQHGGYPDPPETYAADIRRWAGVGELLAAVAQDFMCEPHMLQITGLSVPDHQRLTIERYDQLLACDLAGVYLMPVLQGYSAADYVSHIRQYGDRLGLGAWVGVGSVCKRNGDPAAIREVLLAIKRERPDLRLHGFGLKKTALADGLICSLLYSADSMAWSYSARRNGRNANDTREAAIYADEIKRAPIQFDMSPALEGIA